MLKAARANAKDRTFNKRNILNSPKGFSAVSKKDFSSLSASLA
jgi:hypothetical protein